ncbi:MarR family winged helix-turn-helix transcriptional regulator [Microbulbifer halophilus]|uniref:MarR family winged helix-turn-helix transcriptional regulator n=1 Tax=Microbulbifer halophilus TaxID=453963 RepID=A0ABW5EBB9_9GAMM|nr:MarR family transcriptional regulator [Microbulbifer halophilus]MCW8125320.1 MarR family transcriptional regulator [Microbulbifer halophilus]
MPDTPSLEFTLGALMIELRKVMIRSLARAGLELSPPQTQLLQMIGTEPGISAGALARRSGRDKATITRMLSPLVAEGWILRSPDPEDARRQQLSLSDGGMEVLKKIRVARRGAHEQFFNALSAAEKKQLSGLLRKCLPDED